VPRRSTASVAGLDATYHKAGFFSNGRDDQNTPQKRTVLIEVRRRLKCGTRFGKTGEDPSVGGSRNVALRDETSLGTSVVGVHCTENIESRSELAEGFAQWLNGGVGYWPQLTAPDVFHQVVNAPRLHCTPTHMQPRAFSGTCGQ
jgi:hypothetical protein